jgi:hypothetical protein
MNESQTNPMIKTSKTASIKSVHGQNNNASSALKIHRECSQADVLVNKVLLNQEHCTNAFQPIATARLGFAASSRPRQQIDASNSQTQNTRVSER